jgi:hypothetical protein
VNLVTVSKSAAWHPTQSACCCQLHPDRPASYSKRLLLLAWLIYTPPTCMEAHNLCHSAAGVHICTAHVSSHPRYSQSLLAGAAAPQSSLPASGGAPPPPPWNPRNNPPGFYTPTSLHESTQTVRHTGGSVLQAYTPVLPIGSHPRYSQSLLAGAVAPQSSPPGSPVLRALPGCRAGPAQRHVGMLHTHLTGSSHHDSDDVYMTFATHVFNTCMHCVKDYELTLP